MGRCNNNWLIIINTCKAPQPSSTLLRCISTVWSPEAHKSSAIRQNVEVVARYNRPINCKLFIQAGFLLVRFSLTPPSVTADVSLCRPYWLNATFMRQPLKTALRWYHACLRWVHLLVQFLLSGGSRTSCKVSTTMFPDVMSLPLLEVSSISPYSVRTVSHNGPLVGPAARLTVSSCRKADWRRSLPPLW